MRKFYLNSVVALLLVMVGVNSNAANLILEGNYQGKNLYVQNPLTASGVGFCTISVKVNGKITSDAWNSSAYEIDLSIHGLNVGDPVNVDIEYKSDCVPSVLNPEVLKPKSTFETLSIKVEQAGDNYVLKWKTTNETGKLPFKIQQKVWNKWITVGEVEGEGTAGEHNYEFNVIPHSGTNTFRVAQSDYTGGNRLSKVTEFDSGLPSVSWEPIKVKDDITFSGKTRYEIYDQYGNVVKKGFGDKVNCEKLSSGPYYLNWDGQSDKFIKK